MDFSRNRFLNQEGPFDRTSILLLTELVFNPFQCSQQGCGSGSAWILIHFPSWIRILIQYADPDPGVKICPLKTEKMQGNC